jgi:hypothetical protein
MQMVTTIGLKVHGVDAAGQVVIRRQLKRRPASLIWQARRSASLRQCSSAFGAPIRPLARRTPPSTAPQMHASLFLRT